MFWTHVRARLHSASRNSAAESGWALMDTLAATLVIALAMVATMTSLDASQSTAVRDVRKTVAYDLAQNELEEMRSIGETNLSELLNQDNDTTPIADPTTDNGAEEKVLNGTTYWIYKRAYYVTTPGATNTDLCGEIDDGTNTAITAQYVFISATVTWEGMPVNEGGVPAIQPATLEGYYAAEGGNMQANTSSLRAYLKTATGAPLLNRSVQLYRMPGNTAVGTPKDTNANGCVLFTGLARGDYEVRVPKVGTVEYDLYLTSDPVTFDVFITNRQVITKTFKLDRGVTVTPSFVTAGGTTLDDTYKNALIGPYVAYSAEFKTEVEPDFVINYGFFPPAAPKPQNMMFPLPPMTHVTPNIVGSGYGLFAGPCDVNDPDDGVAGTVERTTLPSSSAGTTWQPGSTTLSPQPQLNVPQMRIRIDRAANSPVAGAKIQVRLVGKAGATGASTSAQCGSRAAMFNKWVRLKGSTDSTGYLPAQSYALPVGKYQICVQRNDTYGWRRLFSSYYDNPLNSANLTTYSPVEIRDNYSAYDSCGDSTLWTG